MSTYTKIKPATSRRTYNFKGYYVPYNTGYQEFNSTSSEDSTSSLTGERKLNWRYLVSQGSNATTPLTATDKHLADLVGNANWDFYIDNDPYWGRRVRSWSGHTFHLFSSTCTASASSSLADNIAREKFYANYRKNQTLFQGGVFLGELRETLHLIRHPAQALRKSISDYYQNVKKRSKNVRRGQSVANVLSNTWLEYVYGVRPLIADINDGLSFLNHASNRVLQDRVILEGKGEDRATSTGTLSYSVWGNAVVLNARYVDTHVVTVKYKGSILCAAGSARPTRTELLGFKWEEFVPTVWELIPYSFLVDYFSNIGEVLSAYSYGLIHLGFGVRTERHIKIRQIDSLTPDVNYAGTWKWNSRSATGGLSTSYVKTLNRSVIQTVPFPSIRLRMPGSDSLRWLNVAALAKLRT